MQKNIEKNIYNFRVSNLYTLPTHGGEWRHIGGWGEKENREESKGRSGGCVCGGGSQGAAWGGGIVHAGPGRVMPPTAEKIKKTPQNLKGD